jgi:FtsH-binding integral membrane protein
MNDNTRVTVIILSCIICTWIFFISSLFVDLEKYYMIFSVIYVIVMILIMFYIVKDLLKEEENATDVEKPLILTSGGGRDSNFTV